MTLTASRLTSHMPVLDPFVSAGLFNESEVELCAAISRLAASGGNQVDPLVLLGIAVAARGPRSGHVCVDLSRVSELIVDENTLGVELPWPDQDTWISALRASENLVCGPDRADHNPVRPLVLDGTRLYLHRYFVAEARVAADLLRRSSTKASLSFDSGDLDSTLDTFFGAEADGQTDLQRQGARSGLTNSFSVLAGGPGTGKTRTVARMLATAHTLARADGRHLLIGLAAPSGKAAARMAEAIEQAVEQLVEDNLIDDAMATQLRNAEPVTIHRLLRSNPRRGFGHNQSNPLALDIIVIDESSMVSLPLMDSLLAAVPDRCHLVLVGDPDQLASVQAGTVLGDIVRPAIATDGRAPAGASGSHPTPVADPSLSANQITVLKVARRFGSDSSIAALADAVRLGDADKTLQILGEGRSDVTWVRPDDESAVASLVESVADRAIAAVLAAKASDVDAALSSLTSMKVLTATRHYELGLYDWSRRVEELLFASITVDGIQIPWSNWYIGRPVLVTRNDSLLRVANGDVGITVDRDGAATVVMDGNPDSRPEILAARLDEVETWWAMTIHKSQGSEFDHSVISLPPAKVPILTRELLYTAITRARSQVTIIGTEEAIATGVNRPISRASGLQNRLWPALNVTGCP